MQDRKARSDQWSPETYIAEAIVQKYQNGMSARQLGFEYGVADVTITGFLKRRGVFIRNRGNARRTNQIREDIFDTITEESAYWIGFLLADGNIHHPPKRSKQLNLGLAVKDWEHLEKFKKFVGSDKPLYYNKNGVFLSIYSNRIVEKLAEYGIVPRKSKTAKVPESLKNNRHFWRGMVDGDGWISPKNFGLCGTIDVVQCFRVFIENLGLILDMTIPRIAILRKTDCCYECRYAGQYIYLLLKHLYQSGDIWLDRKGCAAVGV